MKDRGFLVSMICWLFFCRLPGFVLGLRSGSAGSPLPTGGAKRVALQLCGKGAFFCGEDGERTARGGHSDVKRRALRVF